MSGAEVDLRAVGFSHGPRTVLADVTVTVGAGSRLAVVGPNGVGKSTLLGLAAGDLSPESGTVVVSPPSATVVLLPQERDRRLGETLRGYLSRRTGVAAADRAMTAAADALAAGAAGADDAYAVALDRWLALGGADLESRAPAVLDRLGLDPAVLGRETTTLSGGQLARCSLAAVLLTQVDVLLLDEPTNDLDADGLGALESFLAGRRGALVVVSHDRAFLEQVATDVLEIDEYTRRGTAFGGGFAAYLEERERARAAAKAAFEAYDAKRSALTDRARRDKEWARQGVSRATSAKARAAEPDKFIRAANVASAEGRGAAAARTLRELDRLEEVDDPRDPWELRLALDPATRGPDDVAGLAGAVVARGDFRLGPVDLAVHRGDRVAVTGPNGSGKSTLLGALLGRLPLTSGQAWLGRSVVVGEIDQVRRTFDPAEPLVAAFRGATGQDEADARTLLAKFGLGADDVLRPVGTLSPGERTRADLALLMARRANLLVLDEPTNHLDLMAIEQLEEALATYDGTVLLVTHDRRLLDHVRSDRHVHVDSGRVRED
ncbi:MAG TPA: ABC-F family ATP-binding cassette domain-containing protein [Actinomycetes bacterium]|nr:ABC-F family ATP-binding cassette domain-containing protein [Actinomycetes bacterium]